ncbi:MAG: hypothetical protein KFB96_08570 [Thiocapsa sp.]|uniref:hypothetical protein n=1 Tax=Thiocapsa sp. TaxID=2024551 RepID=UPI001BCF5459|nr:hypothetical protein [Thiocapsa sp.]QVL50462.1 MAG: hypothetical protein KFB96_08570 [Thiocapsa sp.]
MHATLTGTLALAAGLALTLNTASADEVTDQLDAAKQAYEAGELRTAAETLNGAVEAIHAQITAGLLTLFPPPLDGWVADEAQAQSAGGLASMLTGTHLSRRYVREDNAEVTLTLMADSPMMPMLTMAISMPFMMQANEDLKTYSLKGERGMMEHSPGSQTYKVTLMVGNRLLVQGEGSGLTEAAPLEQYLQALDLEAIQSALTD